MEIIPAIDLLEGRCVRLYQGDYGRSQVFNDNPIEVARQWVEQGATRLHVVDLDGAKQGYPVNTKTIAAIVQAVGHSSTSRRRITRSRWCDSVVGYWGRASDFGYGSGGRPSIGSTTLSRVSGKNCCGY